jgi:hypothetical protein
MASTYTRWINHGETFHDGFRKIIQYEFNYFIAIFTSFIINFILPCNFKN